MKAYAKLGVDLDHDLPRGARTRVRQLRSDGPLVLRQTTERYPAHAALIGTDGDTGVSVALVAGAAGPVGGDDFRLDVTVGAGATLFFSAVAGTVILPGPHGTRSSNEVNITVAAGGTLLWHPGVQIAAADCHHATVNRIDVEEGGRLFAREELVLGRHAEQPGRLTQRIRVVAAGRPIYDQELAVGPDIPGWRSSAVTGGRVALGSILMVAPEGADSWAKAPVSDDYPDTAVMRLSDDALLVTALADDAIRLRSRLTAALCSPPA